MSWLLSNFLAITRPLGKPIVAIAGTEWKGVTPLPIPETSLQIVGVLGYVWIFRATFELINKEHFFPQNMFLIQKPAVENCTQTKLPPKTCENELARNAPKSTVDFNEISLVISFR